MQPRIITAALIFLASYLPLTVILLFQDVEMAALARPACTDWAHAASHCTLPLKHPWMSLSPTLLCLASLLVTILVLGMLKPHNRIAVHSATHVPADLMNYTLPYVVSFMSLDYGDVGKLAGFAAFLAWIFVMTLRSGQLLMNPVLTVFGWQLYELEFTYDGGSTTVRNGVALVKGVLEPGSIVPHLQVQDIIIINKEA
jgi:hypothetical protein